MARQLTTLQLDILRALDKHGPMTTDQLGGVLTRTRFTLWDALDGLEDVYLTANAGRSTTWTLRPAGKRAARKEVSA